MIEINEEFAKALDLFDRSPDSLFLTGKAGTGKSTLLQYFMDQTKKNVVVLAPTGVAALNIGGQTIHSFFKFKPGITLDEAIKLGKKAKKKAFYQKIKIIIIDEISMVRADLLDAVDLFLQTAKENKKPFGGIRMIFIGDLYQLPPVVNFQERECFFSLYKSPYFFTAKVMENPLFKLCFLELEKIYRQKDELFIETLNAIRNKTVTDAHLTLLNSRVIKNEIDDEGSIYLTATNQAAAIINEEKLSKIKKKNVSFEADILGNFAEKMAPTDKKLKLKVGAQVMFLMNEPSGLWVNGSIGKVIEIGFDEIEVELTTGKVVTVHRHIWKMYNYFLDEVTKVITQEEVGAFEQFPLKLAWAITIHKSQGKTFDKVIVDLQRGSFAHGQTYVALSRSTSLEGLFLKSEIQKGHIRMDYEVVKFLTRFQYALAEKECSLEKKIEILTKAIEEKKPVSMVYLKANDEKSKRTIIPMVIQEMHYQGKEFLGMEAFCQKRKEQRVFRIVRILELC